MTRPRSSVALRKHPLISDQPQYGRSICKKLQAMVESWHNHNELRIKIGKYQRGKISIGKNNSQRNQHPLNQQTKQKGKSPTKTPK